MLANDVKERDKVEKHEDVLISIDERSVDFRLRPTLYFLARGDKEV